MPGGTCPTKTCVRAGFGVSDLRPRQARERRVMSTTGWMGVSALFGGIVALAGCAPSGRAAAQVVACPGEHIAIDDGVEHTPLFAAAESVDGLSAVRLSGERGYAFAFRKGDATAIGAAMPDRTPLGGLVTLSRASQRGEPVIVARSEGALVGWAERDAVGEPWRVRLVRWVPGLAPETLDVQTAANTSERPPSLRFDRDLDGEHTLLVDAPRLVARR